jgi:hypothetical protein
VNVIGSDIFRINVLVVTQVNGSHTATKHLFSNSPFPRLDE